MTNSSKYAKPKYLITALVILLTTSLVSKADLVLQTSGVSSDLISEVANSTFDVSFTTFLSRYGTYYEGNSVNIFYKHSDTPFQTDYWTDSLLSDRPDVNNTDRTSYSFDISGGSYQLKASEGLNYLVLDSSGNGFADAIIEVELFSPALQDGAFKRVVYETSGTFDPSLSSSNLSAIFSVAQIPEPSISMLYFLGLALLPHLSTHRRQLTHPTHS